MVEVRKIHGKNDRNEGRKAANWSKWMMAAAASAAMASAMPSCSNSEEGPIPIPPVSTDGGQTNDGGDGGMGGSDGGGCVPNPSPACFNASPYQVELPVGSTVSVGDLTIRMVSAHENGSGVEVAEFEILDSCGQRITTETINEGQTKIYLVTGTNLEITVTADEVSVTNPKVKLTVSVRCTTGGMTDGGTTTDGGSSGDGGSGGMDSGTGGTTDAGTTTDSGTGTGGDGGTGGMDSGTGGMSDGGTTGDGGSGGSDGGTGGTSDGGMGGMDSGTGGMDGGITDGGTTDSGTGGSDGGGGMTDGGVVVDGGPACGAASTGFFSGLIANGASRTVGGYVFTYRGPGGSGGALLDVECGGSLLMDDHEFPEDIETTIIVVSDGKKILVTPHGLNAFQTNIDIEVKNN